MYNVNDFVIFFGTSDLIEINSVGVVENIIDENVLKIFFVGKRLELEISTEEVALLDITKTGKPFEMKICNVCHILKKDYVDFEINQTDAQGRKTTRPSCRNCRIDIDGVKLLTSERRRMLEIKPNKFFVCPICEKGSIPDITANLVIDHNHDNGIAREWLCDSCNTGLGRFKDDISALNKAIKYLEKHIQNN